MYYTATAPQATYYTSAAPQTTYYTASAPQSMYYTAAAPQNTYYPAAAPQAMYYTAAAPQASYYTAAAPQSAYYGYSSMGAGPSTQSVGDIFGWSKFAACSTCKALGGDTGSTTPPNNDDRLKNLAGDLKAVFDLIELFENRTKKKETGALTPEPDLENQAFESRMARLQAIQNDIPSIAKSSKAVPTPVATTPESSAR